MIIRPVQLLLAGGLLLAACSQGDDAQAGPPLSGADRQAICGQVKLLADQIEQLPPWPDELTAGTREVVWAAAEAQSAHYRAQADGLTALAPYLPDADQRQEARRLADRSLEQADYTANHLAERRAEGYPFGPPVTLTMTPSPLLETVEQECGTPVETWLLSPGEEEA